MPKKFASENTKAVAAREKKKAAKDADVQEKQKAAEDALWDDDNKQVLKKQQKKDEQDKKKQQQLQKKTEVKALLEKEMNAIKTKSLKAPPVPTTRVTRNQIKQFQAAAAAAKEEKPKEETHLEMPLTENFNRLAIEGDEARTVDEAINILSTQKSEGDMHPEKRVKAAYKVYLERRLKELKLEHPTLRQSQLKQIIFKDWQKSPENPLFQAENP